MSAAVEAEASGLEYLLLEKERLGNTMRTRYPAGKNVEMDHHGAAVEFLGEMRFGKSTMTQEEFLREFIAWADGLACHENESTDSITRTCEGEFRVETAKETYKAKKVIIAISRFRRPNTLPMWDDIGAYPTGIPKELRGLVSFSLDDPANYAGLDVLVIGGGDTAIETALALKDTNSVTISTREPEFLLGKRLSQLNYDGITAAVASQEVDALMSTNLSSAVPLDTDGKKRVETVLESGDGSSRSCVYDRVFLCLGGTTPAGFLSQAGVTFDGKAPRLSDSMESLDVPGLYVIGDLSGSGEKAIVTAVKQGYLAMKDIAGC